MLCVTERARPLALCRDLDGAAASLRRALAIKPDFPEAYVNLGTVEAARSDWPAAIAAYERCIALKPDMGAAYVRGPLAQLLRREPLPP